MPMPFALIPEPLPAGGRRAPRAPLRPLRESRMFQASLAGSGLAVLLYALLAVVLPRGGVQELKPAPYPDRPFDVLPTPAPPKPAGPRIEPTETPPAEPFEVTGKEGVVTPVMDAAESSAPAGPAPSEPVGASGPAQRIDDGGIAPPAPDQGIALYYEEAPVPIREVRPVYPPFAIEAGISGTVLLHVLVGLDGVVEDVKVLDSVPVLDAAAIDAARQWRFKPARVSGRPVRVWVALPMRFRLH